MLEKETSLFTQFYDGGGSNRSLCNWYVLGFSNVQGLFEQMRR